MEAAIGLVPSEIPVLVRVAENSARAIGTALDAGAEGVIVPLIESAEAAAQALSFSRYPPLGMRSGGGVRPLIDFAGYAAGASSIATLLMIETRAGLAAASAIAATEGLDMVFIGPGDLALSLGVAPTQPEHAAACSAIRSGSSCSAMPIISSSVRGRSVRLNRSSSGESGVGSTIRCRICLSFTAQLLNDAARRSLRNRSRHRRLCCMFILRHG